MNGRLTVSFTFPHPNEVRRGKEMPEDNSLRVGQVVRRLGCSRSHIYNLIRQGRLLACRTDGCHGLRISIVELERFLTQSKRQQVKKG